MYFHFLPARRTHDFGGFPVDPHDDKQVVTNRDLRTRHKYEGRNI